MITFNYFDKLDIHIYENLNTTLCNSFGILRRYEDSYISSEENTNFKKTNQNINNSILIDDKYNVTWGYTIDSAKVDVIERKVNNSIEKLEENFFCELFIFYKNLFIEPSTKVYTKITCLDIYNIFKEILAAYHSLSITNVNFDTFGIIENFFHNPNAKKPNFSFGMINIAFTITEYINKICISSCYPDVCNLKNC